MVTRLPVWTTPLSKYTKRNDIKKFTLSVIARNDDYYSNSRSPKRQAYQLYMGIIAEFAVKDYYKSRGYVIDCPPSLEIWDHRRNAVVEPWDLIVDGKMISVKTTLKQWDYKNQEPVKKYCKLPKYTPEKPELSWMIPEHEIEAKLDRIVLTSILGDEIVINYDVAYRLLRPILFHADRRSNNFAVWETHLNTLTGG